MKESRTSYYKKPEHLTTAAWQTELRKQFAADGMQPLVIKKIGAEHPVFTEYSVENPETEGRYKVVLASPRPGENFCACADFKTNALGTCKHIEAVLAQVSNDESLSALLDEEYVPAHTAVYVRYGESREIMIRIGTERAERYVQIAREYFDERNRLRPESYERFDEMLEKAARIGSDFRCYDDTRQLVDSILRRREREAVVGKISSDDGYFRNLIKVPLYPFQREGALFAARAGRCLIADEMGLGKTIQSIAAVELLRRELRAHRALIVCPTSLKYQWKHEIEKFAGQEAAVVEGGRSRRKGQYRSPGAYTITHYHVVGADLAAINAARFDTVILDEAQRIKNWGTKLARDVKRITSTHAIVLTGTPVENKLEELYSIISFIDPYTLGPVHRFLETHQIKDEHGKIIGYRELDKIQHVLRDVVMRRRKRDVLKELPERSDKNMLVAMTDAQASGHREYGDMVARLVNKWKKLGFLDEKDRKRLMTALNCMRMLADSTYILDQISRHDTKIGELMHMIDDMSAAGSEKMIVFSQWERMTRLVQRELEKRGVGFVSLHGAVPSAKRPNLLREFRDNSACRVFLSTDAGGVGLNLQSASVVVNLDLPWNPAVLEQRIGRVWRHGQGRRVSVINFISRGSIEERMQDVLTFKSSLFAGIFDGGESEVRMGESSFKRFMRDVERISTSPAEAVSKTDSGSQSQEEHIGTRAATQTEKEMRESRKETRAAVSSSRNPVVPSSRAVAGGFFSRIFSTSERVLSAAYLRAEEKGDADAERSTSSPHSPESGIFLSAFRAVLKLFSVFK